MNNECSCNRRTAVATLAGTGIALLGGVGAFAQGDAKSTRGRWTRRRRPSGTDRN